jgi:putative FmdB family regulatory protein
MPLFEFTCTSCGKTFEELVGPGDDGSGAACPFCDSREVEKLFSSFASAGTSAGEPAGGGSCGSGGFT